MKPITRREPDPPFDYAASRKRLEAITTDAAMLDAFDRMVESEKAGDPDAFDDDARITRWNDAMGGFIADTARLNISLDHVFAGRGEPFLTAEGAANA